MSGKGHHDKQPQGLTHFRNERDRKAKQLEKRERKIQKRLAKKQGNTEQAQQEG
jgi:hypothetical protein